MKIWKAISAMVLISVLAGCSMSKGTIEDTVKISMQETFNTDPTFREFGFKVASVQVFSLGGNNYKGVTSIIYRREAHTVIVQILVDGDNAMWEAPAGSFMFLLDTVIQDMSN